MSASYKSTSVLLAALMALVCAGCAQQPLPPPNILWITAEDMGPDIGAYGDSYVRTPNLDKLAAEGVFYQNAFATAPVCAVARAALISGMHASSFGAQHMRTAARLPAHAILYPALLRDAGYYVTNNAKTDYNLAVDPREVWDASGNDAHWRNRPDASQPFFAVFNLMTTHESRINQVSRYDTAVADLPDSLLYEPGLIPLPPYFPDTPAVHEHWARYYNIIAAMDQQVGAILKQLQDDGLSENTIVMFYSDHGAGVPRHKRWLFDGGLRVPLIVRVPNQYRSWLPHAPGSGVDELVSFVDLPATALHLAGAPIPGHYQGRPFLGPTLPQQRAYVYAGRDRMDERYDIQRAVRTKRFKYIRYYEPYKAYTQYMNTPEQGAIMTEIRQAGLMGMPDEGKHMLEDRKPQEALYDVTRDPDELTNLVDDEQYADVRDTLRKALAAWSDEMMDTGLIPETVLRRWEADRELSIYTVLRNRNNDMALLRETAAGTQSVTELLRLISHENAAVRYWATIWLGNTPVPPSRVTEIAATLTDRAPAVRIAGARALIQMADPAPALDVLGEALRHEDEWVRLLAVQVLDEIGAEAYPVVPALHAALEDSNKYVVRVANHALNALEGTARRVP